MPPRRRGRGASTIASQLRELMIKTDVPADSEKTVGLRGNTNHLHELDVLPPGSDLLRVFEIEKGYVMQCMAKPTYEDNWNNLEGHNALSQDPCTLEIYKKMLPNELLDFNNAKIRSKEGVVAHRTAKKINLTRIKEFEENKSSASKDSDQEEDEKKDDTDDDNLAPVSDSADEGDNDYANNYFDNGEDYDEGLDEYGDEL